MSFVRPKETIKMYKEAKSLAVGEVVSMLGELWTVVHVMHLHNTGDEIGSIVEVVFDRPLFEGGSPTTYFYPYTQLSVREDRPVGDARTFR